MNQDASFRQIPDPPPKITAGTAIARMLDGLGFRLHWATEGLGPDEYGFRAAQEQMSISEVLFHVWGLAAWIGKSLDGTVREKPDGDEATRKDALKAIMELRDRGCGCGICPSGT
ncbi:MAG: hypothetical protein ACYTAF_15015 [Planctomycetota bacterium]|jgi:hypothetical protein